MNDDLDLDDVSALWRASETVAVDLRSRVARQRAWMVVTAASEIAVMVLFLSVSFAMAVRHPTLDRVLLAVAIWMFSLSAGIFAMKNRAGLWRPEGETTNAFIAILAERARANYRASVFGLYLWVTEVAFIIAFRWWTDHALHPLDDPADLVATLVAVGVLGAVLVCLWRTRARADRLDVTRRQLSDLPE